MKAIISIFLFCVIISTGCQKDQYSYKKFIGGKEIVYAGLAEQIEARSGYLRVQLQWKQSIDPSVVSYILFWNNNKDSASVPATAIIGDSIYHYIIEGLPEYVQGFKVVTINDRGGRSIGQDISSVRVYGPYYQSSLINRKFTNLTSFDMDSVQLSFLPVDSTLIFSTLRFKRSDGTVDSLRFTEDKVTLRDFLPGSRPTIQSYYLPESTAIDTVATLAVDSLQAL